MPQETMSAKLALCRMNVPGEGKGPADIFPHLKLVLYSHDLKENFDKHCLEK